MPRPRVHEPDTVLDVVESLTVAAGPAAVTIRAVSAAVGISNGALYHTFGSRTGLVGQAWLRAGRRFLAVQNDQIERATSPVDAVVAAAEAPVVFAEEHPDSSALFWAVSRDELLASDPPESVAAELRDAHRLLVGVMVRLAAGLWDRKDGPAVDAITTCIVDLPTAIVLRRNRLRSPTARAHLRAAVRAVLELGPPPSKKGNQSWQST